MIAVISTACTHAWTHARTHTYIGAQKECNEG